jgi:hypothetical protein
MMGLVWSNNPESQAGSSIATGMDTHARQVKGGDPDKKGHPGPLDWRLGLRVTTPPHKRIYVEKTSKMPQMGLENRQLGYKEKELVVQRDALQLLGIRGWRRRAKIGMNGGVL